MRPTSRGRTTGPTGPHGTVTARVARVAPSVGQEPGLGRAMKGLKIADGSGLPMVGSRTAAVPTR
ncbi:MAG TPA: hypothetical protein VGJ05_16685 [Fimbriiglobus sp.]|jgi:hypothetical protein